MPKILPKKKKAAVPLRPLTPKTDKSKDIYNINPRLKPFLVPISSLHLDPDNSRQHPERNLQAIKNSLNIYGQQIPVIIKDSTVIKGNGTLEAAKQLGWNWIAAMPFNHVEKKQVRGFALADNRSAELAEWDFQSLSEELRELQADGQDLTELGWEKYEFEPLLAANWEPPKPTDDETFTEGIGKSIHFTQKEYEEISSAVSRLKEKTDNEDITDAQALVEICRQY